MIVENSFDDVDIGGSGDIDGDDFDGKREIWEAVEHCSGSGGGGDDKKKGN